MTMGSLFDGIGGFPLAAIRNRIKPVWASEIEKFPMEVTKVHFPDMLHLGDITKLDGAKIPTVDLVCGGSPCQDLSLAGARKGLAGERSGLFMEQVRIIKEMRDADEKRGNAAEFIRPRYMLWENVMGVFSSQSGEDFKAVLEETCKIADSTILIPRPEGGVWKSAGCILGGKFSVAWRVLDAGYWGVPQRRNRVFLVADFGGHSTYPQEGGAKPKVLTFGLPKVLNNPKYYLSKTACLGILRRAESRGKELPKQLKDALLIQSGQMAEVQMVDDEFKSYHINQRNEGIDLDGLSGALLATQNIQMQTFVKEPLYCLSDQGGECMNVTKDMVGTLRASMGGHLPIIKQELYENHAKDARYTGPLDVAPTISAIYGTGGNNTPFVAEPIAFGIEAIINETDTSHTLDTANPNPNKSQGGLAIVQESYCIAANTINRDVKNGGNGLGCQSDIAYTLTTADVHSVYKPEPYQDVVGAICATDDKGPNNQYVGANKCIVDQQQVFGQSSYGGYGDEISTLCASGGYLGGGSENLSVSRNLVRRLTPLECERLQGFPDNWTNIDGAADSPRYKALGNSIAIPCAEYIMQGIALALGGGDICV
ncbi:DNA cytosine methyltransferase [Chakrabartyella piscis]|uniref:DNA cytosine methyltransferase n=1 Tax=Chakrabartyella piscis TaxID=2918914 RepID=UPI003A7F21BE